ncbi:TolC family protein [Sphaerotilus sp.]|uniref:TolC family protein n=1 Tax=Sphaerotilus sp. TaxID=2093942 RepID=UPI002ACD6441|nr:TolC family protein [Sphaerotilus sp.]MDZ7855780.1 TolC family protein [Sphaerotilus sp.]
MSPRALLAAALLAITAGAQPQTSAGLAAPLSVRDAVRAAVDRAASPAAADATARAAREMAVAAAQRPDPVLRLSLDNLPIDGPDRFSTTRDFMTMRSVALMQMFTREDKRRSRAERFVREAEAAQAERRVRVAAVQREVATAWFERRAAEQRLALLHAQRDEARLQAEAAEAALRGGRGGNADVIAARDALAQLEQALLAARAELANTRRMLARWTGGPDEQPLAEAPALERHAFVAHPVADRLEHHPALVQLSAREATATAEAAVARAEREPDWSAELMFSQRGSRYSNMVSFAVSLPLPWDRPQRQDRELAARLAQAEALRAEREELSREHLAQTEGWLDAWRSGLARLALIDRERGPLAQQRIDAALGAYRGGSAALASVLEARRTALALRMERIDVELETARLWARLEFLVPEPDSQPIPNAAAPASAGHTQGVTR